MSAIGPGDWVECLKGSSMISDCVPGGLYCVEAIVPAEGECPQCGDDTPEGLLFSGHKKRLSPCGLYWSWCPCRFRPIYRPRAEFIESLKQPAPSRELEDA